VSNAIALCAKVLAGERWQRLFVSNTRTAEVVFLQYVMPFKQRAEINLHSI